MAVISQFLQSIKTAIYGEDVRDSIHDAINAINSEVEDIKEDVEEYKQDVSESITLQINQAFNEHGENIRTDEIRQAKDMAIRPMYNIINDRPGNNIGIYGYTDINDNGIVKYADAYGNWDIGWVDKTSLAEPNDGDWFFVSTYGTMDELRGENQIPLLIIRSLTLNTSLVLGKNSNYFSCYLHVKYVDNIPKLYVCTTICDVLQDTEYVIDTFDLGSTTSAVTHLYINLYGKENPSTNMKYRKIIPIGYNLNV